MLRILLDANSIVIPFQFGVDIFSEIKRLVPQKHELVTLSCIIKELENMGSLGKKGIGLIKKKGVEIESVEGKADDEIVKISKEGDWIVLTNDYALKKRLREVNVPIIYLRDKSHLGIEGVI
jgi:rRNA-processing protein FCF1